MNDLFLYQLASLALLAIGLTGLTIRRSFIGILISVELLLNGAGLSIVAASKLTAANAVLGELSALLIMGLAAAEATLVLAIILVVLRRFGHVESTKTTLLRG